MTGVSVAGHNVFRDGLIFHGEAAAASRARFDYQFDRICLLGVGGWPVIIIRQPEKLIDSSLLIYGDAFVTPAVMSVYAAFVVRHGRRLAGDAGITGFAVLVCLLFVVWQRPNRNRGGIFPAKVSNCSHAGPKPARFKKEMTEIKNGFMLLRNSAAI